MKIRAIVDTDKEQVWAILHEVFSAGDTYAFDPKISEDEALRVWTDLPLATYVAVDDGQIVGTYYIKPNQPSLGAHVCNCGYIVAEAARGKGIASTMCKHSQEEALRLGFKAMQFNLVVSTNEGAIRIWQKLGFDIVGTLPKSYNHHKEGFVDSFVMYKWLET